MSSRVVGVVFREITVVALVVAAALAGLELEPGLV